MIPVLNLVTGIISLATNFLIAGQLGLDFYGQYALFLLLQSLVSVLSDMGFSNVLVQKNCLSKKIILVVESSAVIVCGLVGIFLFYAMMSNVGGATLSAFIIWIFISTKNVNYTYLAQRESKVKRIIESDLIYAVTFVLLCSILVYLINTLYIEIDIVYIVIAQCIALSIRAVYIRPQNVSEEYSDSTRITESDYQKAGLQILDRYGRVASTKAEQFIFGFFLQGETLGLVLFISNVTTQIISRLSSPYTRQVISDSRAVSKSLAFDKLNWSVLQFGKLSLSVSIVGLCGIIGVLFFTSYFDTYVEIAEVNKALILFILMVIVARYDVDFVGCALLVSHKYALVPLFNLLYFMVIVASLSLFFKFNLLFAFAFLAVSGSLISFYAGKVVNHKLNVHLYKTIGYAVVSMLAVVGLVE